MYALAFASSCLYFAGIAVFKAAAGRMEPLTGVRPVHGVLQMASSPIWLGGAAFMGAGVLLQHLALTELSVAAAEPAFVAGLVFLAVVAFGCFGERVSGAEWCCLLLMASGSVVTARSLARDVGTGPVVSSGWLLATVVVASLTLPVLVFAAGDRRAEGVHARPLTGVAYGISSGVLIGTAEAAMAAIARTPTGSVLTTPFPVLFVLAVGLGIGQLQIALQRCRMITLVFIATVVAKTQLVILTALVLDPQREIDGLPLSLIVGMTMFTLAITLVPRHDRLRTRRGGLPPAHTTLGMDAWKDQGRGTR